VASRSSVENECHTLQILQQYHVPHIEQCVAQMQYDKDRTMIALTPVVGDRTSSLSNLDNKAQENAIKQVIETMVAMLLANTITVDVQPLITESGEVLFIDFTEARQMAFPPTESDLAGATGFCNEMITLIPDGKKEDAAATLRFILKGLENEGTILQSDIYSIVESIWLEM
jgi:hypothetical protein